MPNCMLASLEISTSGQFTETYICIKLIKINMRGEENKNKSIPKKTLKSLLTNYL